MTTDGQLEAQNGRKKLEDQKIDGEVTSWDNRKQHGQGQQIQLCSVSVQDGTAALGKPRMCSNLSLNSVPKVVPETVPMFVWLTKIIRNLEGGMPVASFLRSFFLRAINVVMVWPVHVQKALQASDKLQTKCDVCCACQTIFTFITSHSSITRAVDPQKSS